VYDKGDDVDTELDLDALQATYRNAVEAWISAIRNEESLASGRHSEAEIDAWEQAGFYQAEAGKHAHAAKQAYEAALREKFFNF
jgi:hypothetical protein